MMTCNTDGAVVIVCLVLMVVRQRHKSGKNEKEYEKYGKLTALVHVPAMHALTIIHEAVFVKELLKACQPKIEMSYSYQDRNIQF